MKLLKEKGLRKFISTKQYFALMILLLVGCQPILVCDSPYIEFEGTCCLDENENSICDDLDEEIIVTNFEECVEAGNPVMESYPRQCRHGEDTFTEEVEILEPEVEEEIEEEPVIEEEVTSELFDVEFEAKKNSIKVRDEAVFLATANNYGEDTDLFIISTPNESWDVKTYPIRNPVSMATRADGSSRLTVNLAPKNLEEGEYTIKLEVESKNTGQVITKYVDVTINN